MIYHCVTNYPEPEWRITIVFLWAGWGVFLLVSPGLLNMHLVGGPAELKGLRCPHPPVWSLSRDSWDLLLHVVSRYSMVCLSFFTWQSCSRRIKAEAARYLEAQAPGLAQHHFCCILLVKEAIGPVQIDGS